MPERIHIKRRWSGAAGPPAFLSYAELFYNEIDDTLYYGKGYNGGYATSIIPIGGPGAFLPIGGSGGGGGPGAVIDSDVTVLGNVTSHGWCVTDASNRSLEYCATVNLGTLTLTNTAGQSALQVTSAGQVVSNLAGFTGSNLMLLDQALPAGIFYQLASVNGTLTLRALNNAPGGGYGVQSVPLSIDWASGNVTAQTLTAGGIKVTGNYILLANASNASVVNGSGGPFFYADATNVVTHLGPGNGAWYLESATGINVASINAFGVFSSNNYPLLYSDQSGGYNQIFDKGASPFASILLDGYTNNLYRQTNHYFQDRAGNPQLTISGGGAAGAITASLPIYASQGIISYQGVQWRDELYTSQTWQWYAYGGVARLWASPGNEWILVNHDTGTTSFWGKVGIANAGGNADLIVGQTVTGTVAGIAGSSAASTLFQVYGGQIPDTVGAYPLSSFGFSTSGGNWPSLTVYANRNGAGSSWSGTSVLLGYAVDNQSNWNNTYLCLSPDYGGVGVGTTFVRAVLQLRNNVSGTPGVANQIHLYDDGVAAYGFGISNGSLDYVVSSGRHAFWFAGSLMGQISSFGLSIGPAWIQTSSGDLQAHQIMATWGVGWYESFPTNNQWWQWWGANSTAHLADETGADWLTIYRTSGLLLVSASAQVNGTVLSTTPGGSGQFRMTNGSSGYGSMWRNDGSSTYLLLTAYHDPFGTWNTLRPFIVDDATGNVTMSHAVTINGLTTINNALNVQNIHAWGTAGSQIDPTLSVGGAAALYGSFWAQYTPYTFVNYWDIATATFEDGSAMSAGVGGGITFAGRYDYSGSWAAFAGIQGWKHSGSAGDVTGDLHLWIRNTGGGFYFLAQGAVGANTIASLTANDAIFQAAVHTTGGNAIYYFQDRAIPSQYWYWYGANGWGYLGFNNGSLAYPMQANFSNGYVYFNNGLIVGNSALTIDSAGNVDAHGQVFSRNSVGWWDQSNNSWWWRWYAYASTTYLMDEGGTPWLQIQRSNNITIVNQQLRATSSIISDGNFFAGQGGGAGGGTVYLARWGSYVSSDSVNMVFRLPSGSGAWYWQNGAGTVNVASMDNNGSFFANYLRSFGDAQVDRTLYVTNLNAASVSASGNPGTITATSQITGNPLVSNGDIYAGGSIHLANYLLFSGAGANVNGIAGPEIYADSNYMIYKNGPNNSGHVFRDYSANNWAQIGWAAGGVVGLWMGNVFLAQTTFNGGGYNVLFDNSNNAAIWMGNNSDQQTYYRQSQHSFQSRGGSAGWLTINGNAVYAEITLNAHREIVSGDHGNGGLYIWDRAAYTSQEWCFYPSGGGQRVWNNRLGDIAYWDYNSGDFSQTAGWIYGNVFHLRTINAQFFDEGGGNAGIWTNGAHFLFCQDGRFIVNNGNIVINGNYLYLAGGGGSQGGWGGPLIYGDANWMVFHTGPNNYGWAWSNGGGQWVAQMDGGGNLTVPYLRSNGDISVNNNLVANGVYGNYVRSYGVMQCDGGMTVNGYFTAGDFQSRGNVFIPYGWCSAVYGQFQWVQGGYNNSGTLQVWGSGSRVCFAWDGWLRYRVDEALDRSLFYTTNSSGYGRIQWMATFDSGVVQDDGSHIFYMDVVEQSGWLIRLGGAAYNSDARLKTDIRPTEVDALATLLAIPVRSFRFTEAAQRELGQPRARTIGLVAQEVIPHIPGGAVSKKINREELGMRPSSLPDDLYTLNDQAFTPYFLRAIQQLETRVAELEDQLRRTPQ